MSKRSRRNDVCKGAALLRDMLDKDNGEGIALQRFHVR